MSNKSTQFRDTPYAKALTIEVAGYSDKKLQEARGRYLNEKGRYVPRVDGAAGETTIVMYAALGATLFIYLIGFILAAVIGTGFWLWFAVGFAAAIPFLVFVASAWVNYMAVRDQKKNSKDKFNLLTAELNRR